MGTGDHFQTNKVAITRRRLALTSLVRLHAFAFRVGAEWIQPKFDLSLRIALAQSFFISGMMVSMHMRQSGLEQPLMHLQALMRPFNQSQVAPIAEILSATLLSAGLFTQLSAFLLLLFTLSGASPLAGGPRLLVCALLLLYVVGGAEAFSLDALFGGLASSALTIAARVLRLAQGTRHYILPVIESMLRVWLGLSLLAGGHLIPVGLHYLLVQPAPTLVSAAYPWLAPAVGALFVSGLATRYASLGALLVVSLAAMMHTGSADDLYWGLILARFAFVGGGRASLDRLIEARLRRQYPEIDGKPAFALEGLPRVVILGAGFAGMSCAKALRQAPVAVTLVDRVNHHLFQPLLYQVATASLSPGDIATPIRSFFRDAFNVRVVYAEATGIDAASDLLRLGELSIPYDFLIIATGATHGYFGRDDWERSAPGLKCLEDATQIRHRLLTAFEKAELADDPAERTALLTFLIVGGGPTGVELAGAIAELTRLGMHRDFRAFDPRDARIILVQSADRILPTFPTSLSLLAQRSLAALGVEVLTDSRVTGINEFGVTIAAQQIPARTVLWAAGVVASPAGAWLGAACDAAGRIIVAPDLTVPNHPNVFAVGDIAASRAWAGENVPGLAPAAKQAGAYAAQVIRAQVSGKSAPPPFKYRHWGSLATIGRKSAVADFGKVHLWGAPAWWLWGLLHVGLLVGVRNRLSTLVNWFWSYITFRSAIRLITGSDR
jgi:NADH dehydrogenase/putative oxidoreductase